MFSYTRNGAYTIEDSANACSTVNRVSKLFADEESLEKDYVDGKLISSTPFGIVITVKRDNICISQRRIGREDMHVDGLANKFHDTRTHTHNHSLSMKGTEPQEIN